MTSHSNPKRLANRSLPSLVLEYLPGRRKKGFRVPPSLLLGASLALGVAVGAWLGAGAEPLGELALLYVRVLKVLATPLVFVAIVDTLASTQVTWRKASALLMLSTVNALVAAAIALTLMHLAPLDRLVDASAMRALTAPSAHASSSPVTQAAAWVGKHLVEPLQIGNLLYVVLFAALVGGALRLAAGSKLARQSARASHVVSRTLAVLVKALGALATLVPLAAFGIVAKITGAHGLAAVPALATFVLLVALGMALHVLGWYGLLLRFVARQSPPAFLRSASDATVTALSTGSSLATLPVTLRVLDRMGVSRGSARLSACLGTNLNHDGIILYEAVAAMFVAHFVGAPLSWGAQLKLVAMSIAAAVGIAGVPEAGLMTLSLVLGAVGLPLGAVPLLMPVDWLLGRLRATTNVLSDMVVATLLDRGFAKVPGVPRGPPLAASR